MLATRTKRTSYPSEFSRSYDFAEEWRQVDGWPYEVSNWGRVRRTEAYQTTFAGRMNRPRRSHDGYHYLKLSNHQKVKYCKVHILVAEAFLGPRPYGAVINHKDGDKLHNAPRNLEYVSGHENEIHAAQFGLKAHGERNAGAKLRSDQVSEIRRLFIDGQSQASLAKLFGVHIDTVGRICRGRTWTKQVVLEDN